MDEEDFDGSALRELLAPAVAGRGVAAAPTDAIVAAGSRRVRGRRVAVAGGALAIAAAVPLAASAIAAGPGGAGTSSAAAGSVPALAPVTPNHSTTPPPPAITAAPPTPKTEKYPVGPLPDKPQLVAQGTLDGKRWTVSLVGTGGNNALTAHSRCLGQIVTDGGAGMKPAGDPALLYCSGYQPDTYVESQFVYDIPGGAGNLITGTAASNVAKVVARFEDGAAPATVQTIPAPGVDRTLYIIPVPQKDVPRIDFDEYDASGAVIGHFDNHSNPPNMFGPR